MADILGIYLLPISNGLHFINKWKCVGWMYNALTDDCGDSILDNFDCKIVRANSFECEITISVDGNWSWRKYFYLSCFKF